eukprot:COSAG01_NODE_23792_length_801_cov_9.273504_2_plen_90_part_01
MQDSRGCPLPDCGRGAGWIVPGCFRLLPVAVALLLLAAKQSYPASLLPTMPPPRLTYLQAFGDDETSVALAPTAGSHEHDGRRGGGDQRS